MVDRILEIQEAGRFLHLDKHNVVVEQKGAEIARIPLEDISVLLLSTPSATLTSPLIAALALEGSPTIILGPNFQPVGEFWPSPVHSEVGTRIRAQVAATLPLKKQLWKALVVKKIEHQAQVLRFHKCLRATTILSSYSKEVRSGDPANREGTAARVYWRALMGREFRRDPDGEWPNPLFNYTYAIIRAAVLRAIWAAGLLPHFGVNHQNRSNPSVLADDLMEPFRPLGDAFVLQALKTGATEMTPLIKKLLTRILWYDLETSRGTTPFSRALQIFGESLAQVYLKNRKTLAFPEWTWEGGSKQCSSADTN